MSIRGSKRAAAMEVAAQKTFTEQHPTGMRTKPICELCLVDVQPDHSKWPVRYEYTKPKRAHRTPLCIECALQLLKRRGSMGVVVERFCVFSLQQLVRSATHAPTDVSREPLAHPEAEAQGEEQLPQ